MALWDLGEGANFVDIWRKSFLSRGDSKKNGRTWTQLGIYEQEGLYGQSKMIERNR